MAFVALDVETANSEPDSICQIGMAVFGGNRLVNTWSRYVDPQCEFDLYNVSIHGIDEDTVRGAITIEPIIRALGAKLEGRIVASHTSTERIALDRAAMRFGLPTIECHWLDTARVARRTWPEIAQKGYGLANVCKIIGHEFNHHDAEHDAIACGEVLLAACRETGKSPEEWLEAVERPISRQDPGAYPVKKAMPGNPDGKLFGEVIVFTGALTIDRKSAIEIASRAGCRVMTGVGDKTTLVVVGDQDIRMLKGHKQSTKHRDAIKRVAQGQGIRIIGETEFMLLVDQIADDT